MIKMQRQTRQSLLLGTQDRVARGNCRIVEPQHSHFPLCALVLSSVKWTQKWFLPHRVIVRTKCVNMSKEFKTGSAIQEVPDVC